MEELKSGSDSGDVVREDGSVVGGEGQSGVEQRGEQLHLLR